MEALAASTRTAGYDTTMTQMLNLRALAPSRLLGELMELVEIRTDDLASEFCEIKKELG